MLHTLWSVKGGSGVSVTAAMLASLLARRTRRAVLVDLPGDQPAVLGMTETAGPGLSDWLASTDGAVDALGRLLVAVGPGLWLLPRGHATEWATDRPLALVEALAVMRCPVVVDAGARLGADTSDNQWESVGVALAGVGRSWLVSRPCYIALRRYHAARARAGVMWLPDGLVVLVDQDRALRPSDVATSVGLPLVATIDLDPAVARAVDAGVLLTRGHRALDRQLRRVA